jgi:hypothetical protein
MILRSNYEEGVNEYSAILIVMSEENKKLKEEIEELKKEVERLLFLLN